ncbi:MAG: hypothetical protein JSW28_06325 [Thermoplasmata archaeon]|nr:MAG: hypothetical protein JSW28_06325 [Thermoplasmata archaeon]
MKAIEASDEILCRFCNLHGGLEAAMPFIAHQFRKYGADFSNPSKEDLLNITRELLRILSDCNPQYVVDRERRKMLGWIRSIDT